MSQLSFSTMSIRGHRINEASWFPAIRELIKSEISAELDESDGLFIGYGMMSDGLPYTLQDNYDTPETTLTFKTAVLENQYLKATFLPELGGRLWSLYDKEHKRDLILANTAFIPCNLAIRNAWFAGGVEFNCGHRGHDEQTASPRFMAELKTPDYPVLRFYEYQRDRGTPFQYDCFLPDHSRFLYIRGRIWNPNSYVVPMYWWSNIAAPEIKGSRIVVPAFDTFANWYNAGSHSLAKLTLPDGEGFDATYPTNFQYVKDHFYNIPEDTRRFECLFHPDGYGFCHVSTKRLRGRKLFVWGQSQGGRHWNRKLLGPGLENYIELQGGLGRSQQECLPMPPKTAWEWLEGYGACTMPRQQVFGSWESAVANTTEKLDQIIPSEDLEKMLKDTHETIALQPGKVIVQGSGWGALEEMRTGKKLAPHLDFGKTGKDQAAWVELLNKQTMTEDPISYQVSDEWFELLKKAKPGWQVHYHLALNYYRRNDFERAENEINASGNFEHNKHLLHLLANIRRKQNRKEEAVSLIFRAALHDLGDASFLKESLKTLLEFGAFCKIKELIEKSEEAIRNLPFIKFMYACALAHTGDLDAAEKILLENDGLDIPDIREGENSTSQLYLWIQEQRARAKGEDFDPRKVQVPFILDLRMSEI